MADALKLAQIPELGFYKKSANGSLVWHKCDEAMLFEDFYRENSPKILAEAASLGIKPKMSMLALLDKVRDKSKRPEYFEIKGVPQNLSEQAKGVGIFLQAIINSTYNNLPDNKITRDLWVIHTFDTLYNSISEEMRAKILPEYKSELDKFLTVSKADYPAYYSESQAPLDGKLLEVATAHEQNSNIMRGQFLKMMFDQAAETNIIARYEIYPHIKAHSPSSRKGGSRKASWAHSKAALSSQKTQWRQTKSFQKQQRREALRTHKEWTTVFSRAARRVEQLESECQWGPKNDAEMSVFFARLFPDGEIKQIFPGESWWRDEQLFKDKGPLSYSSIMHTVQTAVVPTIFAPAVFAPRISRGMMILMAILCFFQGVGASNAVVQLNSRRPNSYQLTQGSAWEVGMRWPAPGGVVAPQAFVQSLLPYVQSQPSVAAVAVRGPGAGPVAVYEEPKGGSFLQQAAKPVRSYLAENPSLRAFILKEQLEGLFTGVYSGEAKKIKNLDEFTNFIDIRRSLMPEPSKPVIPKVPAVPEPPVERTPRPVVALTAEEQREVTDAILDDETRTYIATNRKVYQERFLEKKIKKEYPSTVRLTGYKPAEQAYIDKWAWVYKLQRDKPGGDYIIPVEKKAMFEKEFFEYMKPFALVALQSRSNSLFQERLAAKKAEANKHYTAQVAYWNELNQTATSRAEAKATATHEIQKSEANGKYDIARRKWLQETEAMLAGHIGTQLRWDSADIKTIIGEVIADKGAKITNINVLVQEVSLAKEVGDWLAKSFFGAAESTGAVAPSKIRIHFERTDGSKAYAIIDVSQPAQMEVLRPFAIHNIYGSVSTYDPMKISTAAYLLSPESNQVLSVFDIIDMGRSRSACSSNGCAILSASGEINKRLLAEGVLNYANAIIKDTEAVAGALAAPPPALQEYLQSTRVSTELLQTTQSQLAQYVPSMKLAASRVYQPIGAGGIVAQMTLDEERALVQTQIEALQAAGAPSGIVAGWHRGAEAVSKMFTEAGRRAAKIGNTLADAGEDAANGARSLVQILTGSGAISSYVCGLSFTLLTGTPWSTAFGAGLGASYIGPTLYKMSGGKDTDAFFTPCVCALIVLAKAYYDKSSRLAEEARLGAAARRAAADQAAAAQAAEERRAAAAQAAAAQAAEERRAAAAQAAAAPPPQQPPLPPGAFRPQAFGGTRKRKSNKRKSSKRKSRRA